MFLLYSTTGCHLCDEAKQLLKSTGLTEFSGEELSDRIKVMKVVDVADDERLFEKYGTRIPVLVSVHHNRELAWPFDLLTASDFVRVYQ